MILDYEAVYPADSWHEDAGTVLWWHFPVCEPPVVGTLMDLDSNGEPAYVVRAVEEGWLTHWSRIPIVYEGDRLPKKVIV